MIAFTAGCSGDVARMPDGTTSTDEQTPTTAEPTTTTTEAPGDIPSELLDRFEHIVNMEDEGADPTGVIQINSLLEDNMGDDTLFYFPEGVYKIEGLLVIQHHSNIGIYGPDATLRPTDQQYGSWIVIDDVQDLYMDGPTVNNSANSTGVKIEVSVSGGTNVIQNMEHRGFHDVEARTHAFTLQVRGTDTSLTLENVSMPDGAENGTAIFVHPAEDPGTLRLVNLRIENWYEQGLYGSPHGGPFEIVGGTYANNGKAQVRVGGGNADTRAEIRDVTVRFSEPEPTDVKGNTRGIWLKEGENTLVENCDIEVTRLGNPGSSGAIVIGPENGSCTIRNTRIRVDAPTFAIAASRPKTEDFFIPSMEHPPDNWDVRIENVEITGAAPDGTCIWLVDRPGSVLQDITVDQTGANRNGLSFVHSPGTEVSGLSCSTTKYPVIVEFGDQESGCAFRLSEIERLEGTDLEPGTRVLSGSGDSYCLNRDDGSDSGVVGVTNVGTDGLWIRSLSDDVINPF